MVLNRKEKQLLKRLVKVAIARPFHFCELAKCDNTWPPPGVDMTNHCAKIGAFHVLYTHEYHRPEVMCRHVSFQPIAEMHVGSELLIPAALAELGFEECQPLLYWFTGGAGQNVLHILEPDGGHWDLLKTEPPSIQ